jgi:hypothetical protein
MPDFDGGHYFYTGLVPICNDGIVEHEGLKSSPIHMVREALETLPTALQSHAAEKIGIQSPFARSKRTHFARLIVLDQPYFNGRDYANSIVSTIKGTNLLTPQPDDTLACPYVIVILDFDPLSPSGQGEPRAYFEELWGLMTAELTAVFRYAYGFDKVVDGATFADMMLACQIETTMPFNDYWITPPPFASLSTTGLLVPLALGFFLPWIATWLLHWPWWVGLILSILFLLGGVYYDYALVLRRGAKPLPAAPNSTLRHVLKALYLQQAFTRFAADAQAYRDGDPALGAAFRQFLLANAPNDLDGPTQPPGVIRSTIPGALS